MKKILMRFISLMLALMMCFSVMVSAFAENGAEIKRTCPKVFVNGFMASVVYQNPDDPDSETAWPPSQNAILNAVDKAVVPIGRLVVNRNWDEFGKSVAKIVDELFEPACSDFNGEVTNGSGIRFEYPKKEEIKKDSTVDFCYDWRLDPLVIASQLNDFINYVLECSGSKQVVLECHSLGGVITTSYIKLYGSEKLRSVVLNSTAIYGETYTGELFKGEIDLDADALKYFLDYTFDDTEYEELLSLIFGALNEAGLLDFVCEFGDKMVSEIYDDAMLSVMKLFANWPTIWAMIPDEDLAEGSEYVFKMYDKNGIEYNGLKQKIDAYNTKVRSEKISTLKKLAKNTNVYVIGRYGYCSIPITPTWYALGDGVIDTKYNSLGATTADFGKTLDVEDGKYISPDKTVDASTCLFPDRTWFIRNIKHSDMANCLSTLIDTLLYYDGLANVETFSEYPQFLEYDADNGKLLVDGPEVGMNFIEKLRLIFEQIINTIKSFFLNIGK